MSAVAEEMDGLRMNRSECEAAEAFLRAGELVAEIIRRVLAF
jgi:sporulation-control protein spo0M